MYKRLNRLIIPLTLFLIVITIKFPAVQAAQSTITGYNTQTDWFAGGVGLSSDRATMTINLLTGTTYGKLTGRGDLVRLNETTEEYYKAGYGLWSLTLTGSYTGKLQGTGTGSVSGTITGIKDGDALNIGVGGTWSLELDATLGGMILEIYPTYSNKPSDISYTNFLQRVLLFQPIKEAGSLSLEIFPGQLYISEPGTYRLLLKTELFDKSGMPIPDRKILFDVNSPIPVVQLPSSSTNQDGAISTSLYVTVPDLNYLPQDIVVSASEPLSDVGVSNLVSIEQTQVKLEIESVSPANLQDNIWITDANNIVVTGKVQGLEIESIEMVADVDSVNSSYVYDNRPEVDQEGSFSVPISFYTAGSEYKLTVTASDDKGITVSDTVTVKYLGPSLVKIISVSAPERVDPTLYDSFDVDITVRTVSAEPTNLYLDLIIVPYSTQKVLQVEAGDFIHQVSFNVPISPFQTVGFKPSQEGTLHTLLYTGDSEKQQAQQTDNQGGLGEIIGKTDNGSGDTETFDVPEISEEDIGITVNIDYSLPYPENRGVGNDRFECETKQWTRYSRHSNVLDDLKAGKKTFPQWVEALGVGTNVQWTMTGNIEFEIISATIEVIRLPYNFPEGDTIYVTSEEIIKDGLVQSLSKRWGKNRDIPSGEYKIRVTYRVQYTLENEVIEQEFQKTSRISFHINPKRVDPCGEDFDHQQLYEEKTYEVNRGRTDLNLNKQGDRSTGSFNPGATTSGVLGGLSKPEIHTVSITDVQISKEPITLFLDWDDEAADLDLTLIDPSGRSLGYIYGAGIVVNGIPGTEYSGNDVKPEWIKLYKTIEGEYLISVYLAKSEGPVDAWIQLGEAGGSGLTVNEHSIGRSIDENGFLEEAGFLFSPKDLVYSHVSFSGIEIGDIVSWVFTGPNGQSSEEAIAMEYEGDAFAYAPIDLRNYPSEDVVGSWSVDVYVNDSMVSTASFEVNPIGDLIPGYPMISILIAVIFLVYSINKH